MVAHRTLVDVTDLIEFLERKESASGVQRVVAEVAPLLTREAQAQCVILDRSRGVFVPLTQDEHEVLIEQGARAHTSVSRDEVASTATTRCQWSRNAEPACFSFRLSAFLSHGRDRTSHDCFIDDSNHSGRFQASGMGIVRKFA